jgi:replicative DNA helicase
MAVDNDYQTGQAQGSSQQEGRIPPQAVDIEMAVLGAMLIEREAIARVLSIIDKDVFYKPAHQLMLDAIIRLFERSEPVDIITLAAELRRSNDLDKVGGEMYLTELTMKVATAANAEYHAHILLEKSLMRGLIQTSIDITQRAFSQSEDALDLLDEAEQKIFRISERRMKKNFISIKEAVSQTMEMFENIHDKHEGVTGVPSGYTELDNLMGGFHPGNLIIVAGRPAMGKTAFILCVARNAALHHLKPTPIGFFSLEMSNEELATRLMCAETRVNLHSLRTGKLSDRDWGRLTNGINRLYLANIFIDDTPALGILELRAKARRMKVEHNIGMIVVDYLQLMQGPKGAQSREQEISSISRSLKALAKELSIPVVALSQLNRALETRTTDLKRPQLADLRESGAIEQDADVVLFVHRAELYKFDEYPEDHMPTAGTAEIIIGKQRNGPVGTARLTFLKEYAKFERYAPIHPSIAPPTPEALREVEDRTSNLTLLPQRSPDEDQPF